MPNLLFFVSVILALGLVPQQLHAAAVLPSADNVLIPVSRVVQFTLEFDVQNSSGAQYRTFIRNLRLGLQDPGSFSHNTPVLPPQQNPPTRWFNLVLRTDNCHVTFRIRSDNLYVDGYQQGGQANWLEFNNQDNTHLIPGSAFLGFDGGYNSLERASGSTRTGTMLGRNQLLTAVSRLATSNDRRERAQSLLIVVQMISEAMRFDHILNHIVMHYTQGAAPTTQHVALENSWGDLSSSLLRTDNNPFGVFPLPTPNDMSIQTAQQAASALGLLLFFAVPNLSGSTREFVSRSISPSSVPKGWSLVQICWARMDNIDGEDPGDLFGTITAADAIRSQYIFNENDRNRVSIKPRDPIPITGPYRPLSAASSFQIWFDLFDYDYSSPNDKVSQGTFSWNFYDPGNTYDQVQLSTVNGSMVSQP